MVNKPPGEILQHLYLEERLRRLAPGTFLEMGPGRGAISALLLDRGWRGIGCELGQESAARLSIRFHQEIADARYQVIQQSWLEVSQPQPVDLVISCMVMEHLDHHMELAFMRHAAAALRPGGRMIGFVPAAPRYWGIEDEIAGHYRRYTRTALLALMARAGWTLDHVRGLTFPLSNLLLPLSNYLVRRAEQQLLALPMQQRTVHSGSRMVRGKTHFPVVFRSLLNPVVMRPLHWLQKLCGGSEKALVLYFEALPTPSATHQP